MRNFWFSPWEKNTLSSRECTADNKPQEHQDRKWGCLWAASTCWRGGCSLQDRNLVVRHWLTVLCFVLLLCINKLWTKLGAVWLLQHDQTVLLILSCLLLLLTFLFGLEDPISRNPTLPPFSSSLFPFLHSQIHHSFKNLYCYVYVHIQAHMCTHTHTCVRMHSQEHVESTESV